MIRLRTKDMKFMKSCLLWKASVMTGVLWAAWAAHAGSFQRTDVVADPVWVLHVDCDALKQTVMGKALLTELGKPEAQAKFDEIKSVFNVDPRKDLHGVTLYGAAKGEKDVVVVAYADFDAARLVSIVEMNKDYLSSKAGTHTIHSWIDEKKAEKDGVKPRSYAAIYKGKVLIIGQTESRIAEALDVMDKRKPNLATSTQFGALGANGSNGFIIGAARKLDLPGNDPGAAVLKQSKMFWLTGGESQGRAEVKLTLEAADAETAKQMGDICRGLVAVLSLQTEQSEAVKLAKGISISQEDKAVTAKLSMPSEEVFAMIKAKIGK